MTYHHHRSNPSWRAFNWKFTNKKGCKDSEQGRRWNIASVQDLSRDPELESWADISYQCKQIARLAFLQLEDGSDNGWRGGNVWRLNFWKSELVVGRLIFYLFLHEWKYRGEDRDREIEESLGSRVQRQGARIDENTVPRAKNGTLKAKMCLLAH